jgi:hypothetical protein
MNKIVFFMKKIVNYMKKPEEKEKLQKKEYTAGVQWLSFAGVVNLQINICRTFIILKRAKQYKIIKATQRYAVQGSDTTKMPKELMPVPKEYTISSQSIIITWSYLF